MSESNKKKTQDGLGQNVATFLAISMVVILFSLVIWIFYTPEEPLESGYISDPITNITPVASASPTLAPTIEPRIIKPFIDAQDQRLIESAGERAECIKSGRCSWSHNGWEEFVGRHIKYKTAGEVLAKDFSKWKYVLAAWQKSPTHKAVLDTKWCIYGSAKVGDIYVMHFACE